MKVITCVFGILIAVFGFAMPVSADSPASEEPYTKTIGDDEKYLFVMLPGRCMPVDSEGIEMTKDEWQRFYEQRNQPTQDNDSQQPYWRGDPCAFYGSRGFGGFNSNRSRSVKIRSYEWQITKSLPAGDGKQYPAPGLYRNDGSIEPLWTVDWYAHQVYLSDDGVHLVRMGPWASSLNDLAVAFYTRGKLIKDYTIESLLSDPTAIMRTVSHFMWKNNVVFDAATHQLTIETLSKDKHIFDITTGSLISSKTLKTLNVHAIITASGQQRSSLSHLHNCMDSFLGNLLFKDQDHRRFNNGTLDVPTIIVTPHMENSQTESEDGVSSLKMWSIPLNQIRSIHKISYSNDDSYLFTITFVSGITEKFQLNDGFMSFCGKDENGADVSFQLKDIDSVMIADSL